MDDIKLGNLGVVFYGVKRSEEMAWKGEMEGGSAKTVTAGAPSQRSRPPPKFNGSVAWEA
jgi:hypothetical protein